MACRGSVAEPDSLPSVFFCTFANCRWDGEEHILGGLLIRSQNVTHFNVVLTKKESNNISGEMLPRKSRHNPLCACLVAFWSVAVPLFADRKRRKKAREKWLMTDVESSAVHLSLRSHTASPPQSKDIHRAVLLLAGALYFLFSLFVLTC